jgi:transcriptional regulator with XRE-family HTH domain
MPELHALGPWLRNAREKRGISIRQISDQTKVGTALLEALENGDVSRWPGGIFRRAFLRSYAEAIGVDPDMVLKRAEEELFPPEDPVLPAASGTMSTVTRTSAKAPGGRPSAAPDTSGVWRLRILAVLGDLTVALVIGLGFAAAGSRLLWPVLAIAAYHAVGMFAVGTSPMAALLIDMGFGPDETRERLDVIEADS